MDLTEAERCVHARRGERQLAAGAADLPGVFRTQSAHGLLVSLTTAPGLEFLNQVSGLTGDSIDALPEVLALFEELDAPPPWLIAGSDEPAVKDALKQLGFAPTGPRPIATAVCADDLISPTPPAELEVTEVLSADDLEIFLRVLLDGYDAPPALSDFLRAEHSSPGLRRFLAWSGGEAIAAAGMSIHGGAALLGGAAALASARGRGAQTALLRHRLTRAGAEGATVAVATASPSSVSLRNLIRAGFAVTPRPAWAARTPS
jgi:GNAT superfamily N-acetyltransferase